MQHTTFIGALLLATVIPLSFTCEAQNIKVVGKTKIYRQEIKRDSSYTMVELKARIPDVVYDLRYAGKNNFTNQQLYSIGEHTFLRLDVAKALAKAQAVFKLAGYSIKIFDAYRPYNATRKMWDLIKDERYVANPTNGSGHNRGLSVDLTLIDVQLGEELDMGTGFDSFTDTAHHTFKNLSPLILKNRALLKTVMEAQGFKALDTEWWHYSWPNNKNYSVLNLSFQQLNRSLR